MARNQWKPCSTPACPTLVDGPGRCPACRAKAERQRGNATERGYDARHRALKARLMAALRRAERRGDPLPVCRKCDRPMSSAQPLDLGHREYRALEPGSRADALEHAACNRADGGRLGAMITNSR